MDAVSQTSEVTTTGGETVTTGCGVLNPVHRTRRDNSFIGVGWSLSYWADDLNSFSSLKAHFESRTQENVLKILNNILFSFLFYI